MAGSVEGGRVQLFLEYAVRFDVGIAAVDMPDGLSFGDVHNKLAILNVEAEGRRAIQPRLLADVIVLPAPHVDDDLGLLADREQAG